MPVTRASANKKTDNDYEDLKVSTFCINIFIFFREQNRFHWLQNAHSRFSPLFFHNIFEIDTRDTRSRIR